MPDLKTLVLGASSNPSRYAYLVTERLQANGHTVWPVGIKPGAIGDLPILTELPKGLDVHTITLYINPQIQKEYYDYLLDLKPQRVIFNPGTENLELQQLLEENGIETLEACTLVLLSIGQY